MFLTVSEGARNIEFSLTFNDLGNAVLLDPPSPTHTQK